MAKPKKIDISAVDKSLGLGMTADDLTHDGQPRCMAKSKQSGQRCKRARTPGATVCASHGGSAPQVKRKARLRLLDLVEPVTTRLGNIALKTDDERVFLKAAEMIYDRTGLHARTAIDIDDSRDILVERLRALQRSKGNDPEALADVDGYATDTDDIDDEVTQ